MSHPPEVLDGFAGPGGWSEALRALGLRDLGIELDAAACATRAAAGHATVRADVSKLDASRAAGFRGHVWSPPCITYSAAGNRAGMVLMEILAATVRDLFAGRDTRRERRRGMGRVLHAATPMRPTTGRRAHRIAAAVRSATLVAEPARFIYAGRPEWVALEQVPSVLPLWRTYAAELARLGYSVWAGKLNAADYGVPQTRIRAILIASRVRRVTCPEPTHYDPRKGDQLWGEPWVSMAQALGWGASGRPGPSVTAGGTATGGAEPFARGGREALEGEQNAGRWILQRQVGASLRDTRRPHEIDEPAPTITGGGSAAGSGNGAGLAWTLRMDAQEHATTRPASAPAPAPAPAPALKFGHSAAECQWVFRNNNNNNACERSLDEPAGTLFFGHRSNWAAWVAERPATTVCGRGDIESHFAVDSVRITVQEAAILQSFRPDYPWQGTKTKQFEQVGNAMPPLLAEHVIAMAAGIRRNEAAA